MNSGSCSPIYKRILDFLMQIIYVNGRICNSPRKSKMADRVRYGYPRFCVWVIFKRIMARSRYRNGFMSDVADTLILRKNLLIEYLITTWSHPRKKLSLSV